MFENIWSWIKDHKALVTSGVAVVAAAAAAYAYKDELSELLESNDGEGGQTSIEV